MSKKWLPLLSLIIFLILLPVISAESSEPETILLTVGDCKIFTVENLVRVSSSNPEVIEIVVTSGRDLLCNAKKPGLAVVNIWTKTGLVSYRIAVQEDYSNVEREIARLIGNPAVQIRVNAKYVILTGNVENSQEVDQAIKYGKMYRENVIENLTVKTKSQVLLSMLVTEIKKEAANKYGFRWGSWVTTTQGVVFNEWNWGFSEQGNNSFGRYPGNWAIGAMLDAMQRDGDAKILAAPSILTANAKEAYFLAGGEIPIPVIDAQGGIKVEWKEYGIKLKVTPTIEKDGMISMQISSEVSALDWSNAVESGDNKFPALTTRKATTSLEFNDGGTFVIGGLLKREDLSRNLKIPFLGDLPIIGKLFQSKDFQKGDTELLFFVSPKIVKNETQIESQSVTKPSFQGPYYDTKPLEEEKK